MKSGTQDFRYHLILILAFCGCSNNLASFTGTVQNVVPGSYIYVADGSNGNIYSMSASQTDGSLTLIGSSATGSTSLNSLSFDQSHGYLLSAGLGSASISTATIASNGLAQTVLGSPFVSVSMPGDIVTSASNACGYVDDASSNNIDQFTFSASSGAVGAPSAPLATGTGPAYMRTDISGKFIYLANQGSSNVSAYQINSDCSLTSLGNTPSGGTYAYSVSIDPLNRFLFVPHRNSADIGVFTINSTTGAITAVAGSPFTTGGTKPRYGTPNGTGKFYYATNSLSNNITEYSINQSTGVLTSIGVLATGASPYGLYADPSGKFLYVGSTGTGSVYVYQIDQTTGLLTQSQIFSVGSNPKSIIGATY